MGLLGPISLMCPLRLSAFSTQVPSLPPSHPSMEVSPSPEMHICAWEPPRTDSHGWMWQVGWGLCTHWGLCPLDGGRPLLHFPPADYTVPEMGLICSVVFKRGPGDVLGSPVVETLCSQCRGHGFTGWGIQILHAICHGLKRKKKKRGQKSGFSCEISQFSRLTNILKIFVNIPARQNTSVDQPHLDSPQAPGSEPLWVSDGCWRGGDDPQPASDGRMAFPWDSSLLPKFLGPTGVWEMHQLARTIITGYHRLKGLRKQMLQFSSV